MLSRVLPGELRPAKHEVGSSATNEKKLSCRHSTCGQTFVLSELQVTTVANHTKETRRSSSNCSELPILRSQYVARGVRVLFGSRWRLNHFQIRTIVLFTGEKPSLFVYSGESGNSPESTHILDLDTSCELIGDVKSSRAAGLQLTSDAKTSNSSVFRLRIRFATAADATIWRSIIRETLTHAKWSQDVRPVQQKHPTQARNIRLVQHMSSSERFVVKVLARYGEQVDCHELHILRRLYSSQLAKNVSLVYGYRVVETSSETLLIMPQLLGGTLLTLLRQRRKSKQLVKREEAWCLVKQLATLLQAVHQTGIVHSDLNLENVILTSDFACTWLIDFGGAVDLLDGQNLTRQTQQMTGTPGFVAPERVQNPLVPATPKSDVFSFGVLLFQVLSGQHPYFNATDEKRDLKLEDSLSLDWCQAEAFLTTKAVPSELRELIEDMLVADPLDRIGLDAVFEVARRKA